MIGRPEPLDPEAVFTDFWADIVCPDGVWDYDQLKLELCDYHMLIQEVPKVYDHITWGRISKPTTLASEVISVHDDLWHYGCDGEHIDGEVCE